MRASLELEGIDVAWLAVDSLGQLAIFATGGAGPIPENALAFVELAEETVLALAETSNFELLTSVKRPDDFIAFAKRGVFAYDWSDVHRATNAAVGGYELQARPTTPLAIEAAPSSIQSLARATQLQSVLFGAGVVQVGT